jgi:hypothetical protein
VRRCFFLLNLHPLSVSRDIQDRYIPAGPDFERSGAETAEVVRAGRAGTGPSGIDEIAYKDSVDLIPVHVILAVMNEHTSRRSKVVIVIYRQVEDVGMAALPHGHHLVVVDSAQ